MQSDPKIGKTERTVGSEYQKIVEKYFTKMSHLLQIPETKGTDCVVPNKRT